MEKEESLIICRCEEVSEKEIREAIKNGYKDLDSIKRKTRAGMGLCQGRTCSRMICNIISEMTNKPLKHISFFPARAPLKPIPIEYLREENE